jgi:hypothetical protein
LKIPYRKDRPEKEERQEISFRFDRLYSYSPISEYGLQSLKKTSKFNKVPIIIF